MTTGSSFIRACCVAESAGVFRQSPPDWYSEGEEPLYSFVSSHLRSHGRMPSIDTLREEGFSLTRADEPPSFYLERLRTRARYDSVNSRIQNLTEALAARQMDVVHEVLSEMRAGFHDASMRGAISTIAEEAAAVVREYEEAQVRQGLLGITTGWPTLDRFTQGLVPGDVGVFVGRPGVGKSFLLLHMAYKAWQAGHSSLITSMEMGVLQMARRLVSMEAGINPDPIRRGQVSTWNSALLQGAPGRWSEGPPMHFFSGNVRRTTDDLDAMIQEVGPDVVYLDSGYLLSPSRNRRRSSRREYIADVMEEVKAIAQERAVPIVVTVQFNREASKKKSNKMGLHMIAEADVIGQIASMAVGVSHGSGIFERSRRHLTLMKNRDGDEGEMEVRYQFSPPDFAEVVAEDWQTAALQETDEEFGP